MATIFAATSLDLTEEQRDSLADALINDLGTIYKHALSFNLVQIPQDSCRGDSINQTTFFVCVPPYATLEKKRETIELLHNTMVRETGYQGELKNIVLFQYHDDDGSEKTASCSPTSRLARPRLNSRSRTTGHSRRS